MSMSQTDAECVRLCLNGNREAFGDLVQRYQAPLVRYLTGRLGSEEEAVEAAQETVVRAYCTLRKLKKPESFHCWLLGIAGRVAKETQRKRHRRGQIVSLPGEPAVEPGDCPDTGLDQAVAGLPETYRQVVLLRYYGGLSCAEVGRELGVPVGTVTMRLSRAYGLLRECLAEED
jgi:RNA polymerase sigma-70 factor (ECF subfamily)